MKVDGFSVSVVLLHVLKYCIIATLLGALFFLTNVRNSFANSSPTCHPSSFIFPMTMPCSPEILPPSYHFIYFFLCLALRNMISMRKVQRVSHVYFIYSPWNSCVDLVKAGKNFSFIFHLYKGILS